MAVLGNPQETICFLKKYDFHFNKRLGQNFLIDPHVLEKTVEAAAITPEDFVLEIGPGIGTLTQYLCERAKRVLVVELDARLIPILEETLSEYNNIDIIHGDILKQDIFAIARDYNGGRPIKVVANLPYYITTPVIMELFESGVPLASVTVMVQKEVAERMRAVPGTKDYGALSLAVQFYSEPAVAANVPPNCFIPRPGVGSAVVHLRCLGHAPVEVRDEKWMFRLIRAAFNQRRKTLVNALANSRELNLTKEDVAETLGFIGWKPDVRGEKLGLEEFATLSDALQKRRKEDGTI